MAGPFDFLHIKGRTAGSSNELSFDVLDSRRGQDPKKSAQRITIPTGPRTGPRASQGNYRGISGTSTLSAVPEVERRKRVRRRRRIRNGVLATILVVALVALGGYAGFRLYEDTLDFTKRFDMLIDQFIDVDNTLVEVDSLMSDPLNSVNASEISGVLESIPDAEAQLDAIIGKTDEVRSIATQANDVGALDEVTKAAEARKQMLIVATDTFKLAEIANRQVADANNAWNKVLSGDDVAREATRLANAAATEDATVEALEKTEEALFLMESARDDLNTVEHGLPGLDFSAETAYVLKRIESLEAAVNTSNALLSGDRANAIAYNAAYNTADEEAAALAAALPAAITDQVKTLYAKQLADKQETYSEARAAASTADATIRAALSS